MSKIFKRPMFRKGGSVDGIMTMAVPRKQYADGTSFEEVLKQYPGLGQDIKKYSDLYGAAMTEGQAQQRKDILANLLIRGGMGLVSGKGAGKGTLGAIATAYEKPTEEAVAQISAFKQAPQQARMAAVKTAVEADLAQKLAAAKKKVGYAEQTRESRFKVKLGAASKEPGFDEVSSSIRINKELDLEDAGLYGSYRGVMVDDKGQPIKDEIIEKNDNIPDGSIFYDPKTRTMKQKKNGVLIPIAIKKKGA